MCKSRVASEHFGPGKGAQHPAFRRPGGRTDRGDSARARSQDLSPSTSPSLSCSFQIIILQKPSDSEWRTESVLRLNFVNEKI